MRQRDYSRTPFCFFKKTFYEKKKIFLRKKFSHDFSRKMFLLTDQVSLSDCLYFLIYRAIFVLQMFVSAVVTLFF